MTHTTETPIQHTEPMFFSGISLVEDGEILARGLPINDLIQSYSYVQLLFFQLQARLPTHDELIMMNAYLVSLCEHGVTSPSSHGPRVTSSVRSPFPASAISFIASAMGPFHFGALERAMLDLIELDRTCEGTEQFVERHINSGLRIWGYGHRFHKSGVDDSDMRNCPIQEDADPRVRSLLTLADQIGWHGKHLAKVRSVGKFLHERKNIPINIDGIAAGLLLDMGFLPDIALLFVIIGRLPNIARLHLEEQNYTPNRFTALATERDPGFERTIDRNLSDKDTTQ